MNVRKAVSGGGPRGPGSTARAHTHAGYDQSARRTCHVVSAMSPGMRCHVNVVACQLRGRARAVLEPALGDARLAPLPRLRYVMHDIVTAMHPRPCIYKLNASSVFMI